MSTRSIRFKTKIIETFFKLIEEQGYEKITITKLCQSSGVSRQGFYMHYKSLEDIIVQEIAVATKKIFKLIELEDNLDAMIETTYQRYYLLYQENKLLFSGPTKHIALNNFRKEMFYLVSNFYYQQHGELSKTLQIEIEIESNIYVNVFDIVIKSGFTIKVDQVKEIIKHYIHWGHDEKRI